MEESLQAQCDVVREVAHTHARGMRQRVRQVRVALSVLAGRPAWVSWWAVPEYGRCVRELAASWQPDLVQLEFHLMGQYLMDLRDCPAPRLLVEHEPGAPAAEKKRLAARGPARRAAATLDARAWRRYEPMILRQVQAAVVFTERDRAELAPLAGATPLIRIPLGTALPREPLDPLGVQPPTVVFVGSFAHQPNADAAHRLVVDILPRVRAVRPEVRLVLVGSNPPADLRRHADDHVEITGSVPDVTPYLDRASLVAVPLRLGGGMRVKVIEALAAGKAVVGSRLAVEGLDIRDGEEIALAESDEDFSRQILSLLADSESRQRLAAAAWAWASNHPLWSEIAGAYERVYDRLLEGR
jgi:glycosyltransferase involved in cell wall biosynthesis